MATQIQLITLIALAVLGGVASAILGWMDSGDPFDSRKFGATILRAIIGAAIAAMTFQGIESVDIFIYLSAFITGAGTDVIGKRLQEVIQKDDAPKT